MRFLRRLTQPRPLLLDGATGTELERRAVDVGLPLWSANALLTAPEVLRQIHADYMRAGAEIITADTFRTHRRNLVVAGMGHRAEELTRMAVRIARSAIRARTEVFDPEKGARRRAQPRRNSAAPGRRRRGLDSCRDDEHCPRGLRRDTRRARHRPARAD